MRPHRRCSCLAGYLERSNLLQQVTRHLDPSFELPDGMITVRGMGGSGKTAFVAATARDREVGAMFERICFVGLGQEPSIHDLQLDLHIQLCDTHMKAGITDQAEAIEVQL